MILNIPLTDNDGNTQTAANITPAQLKTLEDLIKTKGIDQELLLTFLEVESLEMLPSKFYMKAMSAISVAKKAI
jgi:ABC-type Zn uptake system ZnuABC Zn-binding protein ZnuA